MMMQSKEELLHSLETLVQQRLQSAQQRVKQTHNVEMKRYYKGQADALHIVLRDIDTAKFELGMELMVEPSAPVEQPVEQVVSSEKVTAPVVEAPPVSPYDDLAREAVRRKIVAQKYSWFFHDLLPKQGIRGYRQLAQALEKKAAFRKAVQAACARPDGESAPVQKTPQTSAPAELLNDPHAVSAESPF